MDINKDVDMDFAEGTSQEHTRVVLSIAFSPDGKHI